MQRIIIEFGAYNTTFWFAVLIVLILLCRGIPPECWSGWRPLAIAIAFGTALNLSIGLYRAYVAPRDLMQDIVSAQEYLAGRSMYPDNLQESMQRTLDAGGERRYLPLGAIVSEYSIHSKQSTVHQHWVQAHPPAMTAFIAMFLNRSGVLGTQIAFAVIALLSWGCSIFLLTRELRPNWGEWKSFAVVAASLGAGPLVTSLRNGQSDLFLGALVIASWALVRHGRFSSAGVVLGLAISLKLVPAVLLPIFLVRWPRAFLAALGTYAITAALVLSTTTTGDFQRYLATAAGVVDEYANYPSNISLLGFLARAGVLFHLSLADVKPAWFALGLIVAIGLSVLARKSAAASRERETDLLFGLGVCLIPLSSPVAWDHYLAFLLLPLALASVTSNGMPKLLLASLILLWCIPETAWLNIFSLANSHNLKLISVWFLEPLRMYALLALAGWLGLALMKIDRNLQQL